MAAPSSKDREKQLVTFRLGPEEYGIEIGSVQEIIKLPGITRVPKSPHYLEGVVNLRGHILPIIDTRKRLNMEEAAREATSRIVVTNLDDTSVGLVVDSVSEVLRVESALIEPTPPALSFSAGDHINGICKLNSGERLVSLLNLPNITRIEAGAEDEEGSSDYPVGVDSDAGDDSGRISDEIQMVSFALGAEEYAIDINQVEEIIKIPKITAVPDAPMHTEGIICLRGSVMPVMNLRSRFGMETREPDKRSRILIIRLYRESGKILFGMMVDMVNEVVSLPKERIEPTPDGLSDGGGHLTGIGKLNGGGRLIMVLDPEKLMMMPDTMEPAGETGADSTKQGYGSEVRSPLDIKQMVSLKIGSEEFGIDIMNVREIIRLTNITNVPGSPHYVKGVVNLRGDVLPVIDLRSRFGMEWKEQSDSDRIVVVTWGDRATGLIVDSVSEVFQMPVKDIEPTPDLMSDVDASFIQGIGKLSEGKRFVIILNIARVLNIRELNHGTTGYDTLDSNIDVFTTIAPDNETKTSEIDPITEVRPAESAKSKNAVSEEEQLAALQAELLAQMDDDDDETEVTAVSDSGLSEEEQLAALQAELLARMDEDEESEDEGKSGEELSAENRTIELSEEEQLRILQEQLLAQMGPEDDDDGVRAVVEEESPEGFQPAEVDDKEPASEDVPESPAIEGPVEKSGAKKKTSGKSRQG